MCHQLHHIVIGEQGMALFEQLYPRLLFHNATGIRWEVYNPVLGVVTQEGRHGRNLLTPPLPICLRNFILSSPPRHFGSGARAVITL
jgi:hypothetical protein